MNHITEDKVLEIHIMNIKDKANSIIQNYISIGFSLITIRDKELYKVRGYNNLIECMEQELNMKKSTCYNLMRIAEKFGDQEKKSIKSEYTEYGYVQLLEMTTMKEEDLQKITPEMSKREIQNIKKDNSNQLEKKDAHVIEVDFKMVEDTPQAEQDLFGREDALLSAIDHFYNHSWPSVVQPIIEGIERNDKDYIRDSLKEYAVQTRSGGSIYVNGLHCLRECSGKGFEIKHERLVHEFTWNEIAKKLLEVYSSDKPKVQAIEPIEGQTSICDTCTNLGDPCTEKKANDDTCIGHDAALIEYASNKNELIQIQDEESREEENTEESTDEVKESISEINLKMDMVAACIQKAIDVFRTIRKDLVVVNDYNSSTFGTHLFNMLHTAHVLRPHSKFSNDPYPLVTVEGWDVESVDQEPILDQERTINNDRAIEMLKESESKYDELMKPYIDAEGNSICQFLFQGRNAIYYEMGKQAALKALINQDQEVHGAASGELGEEEDKKDLPPGPPEAVEKLLDYFQEKKFLVELMPVESEGVKWKLLATDENQKSMTAIYIYNNYLKFMTKEYSKKTTFTDVEVEARSSWGYAFKPIEDIIEIIDYSIEQDLEDFRTIQEKAGKIFYTKCGRPFKKQSTASTTGYEYDKENPLCKACPFKADTSRYRGNELVKIKECRAGDKKPNPINSYSGDLDDTTNLHVKSLHHEFLEAVTTYCEKTSYIEYCSYTQDDSDCRRVLTICFAKNRKGIAAKKQLVKNFFPKGNDSIYYKEA